MECVSRVIKINKLSVKGPHKITGQVHWQFKCGPHSLSLTNSGCIVTDQVRINLIWSAFIKIDADFLSGMSFNSWKHHMVFITIFKNYSLVTFCLGGKILTPVPRRLGVISECWPVANESWGTFWSGQVKYEFRKLSKCVDLIKCSLTFTNEHELTDTQKPHVEPTEFVSL